MAYRNQSFTTHLHRNTCTWVPYVTNIQHCFDWICMFIFPLDMFLVLSRQHLIDSSLLLYLFNCFFKTSMVIGRPGLTGVVVPDHVV